MKKFTISLLSIILAALSACAFSGCDSESSSQPQPETTVETTEAEATEPQTTEALPEEFVLSQLHSYDMENGDAFAGVWQITDGVGSDYSSMVYLFDGFGNSTLIMGTTGYCGPYENDTAKNTFTCKLMFGINGTYSYKADGDAIVLTNTESGDTTTITRLVSYDFIPLPDADASIDDALVGAWMADDGECFYFDDSGIMYQNQYGAMFIYYSYSANDGKITAVYDMGSGDETEEFEYSVKDDVLTLDGYEYSRTTADELY